MWTVDGWTGYEGAIPIPDDLGCKWYVTETDGWFGLAEPRVTSTDLPNGDGTDDGPSTQPGRAVTITGMVRAPDQVTLLQAMDRISGLLMAGSRSATLTVAEPHMTRYLGVRRGGALLVKPTKETEASFSVLLYGADPRRLGDELVASTGLPSSSGGLTVPFSVPAVLNSTIVSGQVVLQNPGPVRGPMRLRIDGPCVGPVVTHVGAGLTLAFASSYSIGAGSWLDVDLEAHEVLENGQASRNAWITSRGWFGLDPGPNVVAFTARNYTAGARLTVYASPAY